MLLAAREFVEHLLVVVIAESLAVARFARQTFAARRYREAWPRSSERPVIEQSIWLLVIRLARAECVSGCASVLVLDWPVAQLGHLGAKSISRHLVRAN